MVIVINNYTWQQNNKKVIINVPITPASKDNLSIICTENYLKVSKPPYIFEACLPNSVDHDATTVKVVDREIVIELTKLSEKRWDDIRKTLTKEEQMEERMAAQQTVERMEKEGAEKRSEVRQARERLSVSEQMKLDDQGRKSRENAREREKQQALAEAFRVSSSKSRKRSGRRQSEVTIFNVSEATESQSISDQEDYGDNLYASETSAATTSEVKNFRPLSTVHAARSATPGGVSVAEQAPPVRTRGTILTSHTPRSFPTAARESKSEEEQEWLRKQAAAFRRDGALTDEDLRPHEHDSRWLKERGDTFYQRGNYLAAVNAYSHALHVSSKAPELYSNRAAAHLKLNNYHKALEDSSSALELLTPPVKANQQARLRCHVRRGTALMRLAAFPEALAEYNMACSLDPTNQKLTADTETIRRLAEGDSEEDDLVTLD